MKTTVEISDELLERARTVARRESTTLRALLEDGLRRALSAREVRRTPRFELPTFEGDGLTPEFDTANWSRIRDEIYRDRG